MNIILHEILCVFGIHAWVRKVTTNRYAIYICRYCRRNKVKYFKRK